MDEKNQQDKKDEIKEAPAVSKAVYEDSMGVTDKKLEFGLWYVRHLKRLKRFWLGFIIAVCLLGWGYFFYGFLHYIFVGMAEDQAMVDSALKTQVASHNYFAANQPKDLIISAVEILNNSTEETYDLIGQIENPNFRHWAEFSYIFRAGGEEFPAKNSFIYPGEKKYLADFSVKPSGFSANAEIIITNISWHPIKAREIPDWPAFYAEHVNFVIGNPKVSLEKSETPGKINLCQVDFTAGNGSPYNYWNINFLALVFQGGRIASVSSLGQEEFMSGQSYDIKMIWPSSISYASRVEIIPEVNFLSEGAYIPFTGADAGAPGREVEKN